MGKSENVFIKAFNGLFKNSANDDVKQALQDVGNSNGVYDNLNAEQTKALADKTLDIATLMSDVEEQLNKRFQNEPLSHGGCEAQENMSNFNNNANLMRITSFQAYLVADAKVYNNPWQQSTELKQEIENFENAITKILIDMGYDEEKALNLKETICLTAKLNDTTNIRLAPQEQYQQFSEDVHQNKENEEKRQEGMKNPTIMVGNREVPYESYLEAFKMVENAVQEINRKIELGYELPQILNDINTFNNSFQQENQIVQQLWLESDIVQANLFLNEKGISDINCMLRSSEQSGRNLANALNKLYPQETVTEMGQLYQMKLYKELHFNQKLDGTSEYIANITSDMTGYVNGFQLHFDNSEGKMGELSNITFYNKPLTKEMIKDEFLTKNNLTIQDVIDRLQYTNPNDIELQNDIRKQGLQLQQAITNPIARNLTYLSSDITSEIEQVASKNSKNLAEKALSKSIADRSDIEKIRIDAKEKAIASVKPPTIKAVLDR